MSSLSCHWCFKSCTLKYTAAATKQTDDVEMFSFVKINKVSNYQELMQSESFPTLTGVGNNKLAVNTDTKRAYCKPE